MKILSRDHKLDIIYFEFEVVMLPNSGKLETLVNFPTYAYYTMHVLS